MKRQRNRLELTSIESLEERSMLSATSFGKISAAARTPVVRSLPVSIIARPTIDSGYTSVSGRVTARSVVRLDVGSDGSFEQVVKADKKGNYSFKFYVGFGATKLTVASGSGRQARYGTLTVNRVDHSAPSISIQSPASGEVFSQIPVFSGQVKDRGAGVYQLACRVEGEEIQWVPFDASGNFAFSPALNSDGSDDGARLIRFQAIDRVGNLSQIIEIPFDLRTRTKVQSFVIDTPVLAVGASDSIRFQVEFPDATNSQNLELYEWMPDGTYGAFLGNLVDNGDPFSGDAVADDDRFSVILPFRSNTAGNFQFAVKINGPNVDMNPLVSSIQVVEPPSVQRLNDLNDYANSTGNYTRNLLVAGQSEASALNAAKSRLMEDTENVMAGSIVVHNQSISWKSTEGILFTSTVGPYNTSNVRSSIQPDSDSNKNQSDGVVSVASIPDCKGKVKVLAPYFWQFENIWGSDESNDIAQMFRDKGYEVESVSNFSEDSNSVSLEDFKNLGKYEAVVITSHGEAAEGILPRIYVSIPWERSLSQINEYASDILSGRIGFHNFEDGSSELFITSEFISHYSPKFDDTIVYVGACRSGMDSRMSQAFLGNGAQAFIGYTDYVQSEFAFAHGLTTFATLLAAEPFNSVGSIPGINFDIEVDKHPARFVAYGDLNAKLKNKCGIDDLYIEYRWAESQKDLDTSTKFIDASVGYDCRPSNTYVSWTGDDTSRGGKEIVQINLEKSLEDNKWSNSVIVSLAAGWYTPAEGSGPATLTIGLKNRMTNKITSTTIKTISPGSQSGCAQTAVGTITITVHNPGAANTYVSYSLS